LNWEGLIGIRAGRKVGRNSCDVRNARASGLLVERKQLRFASQRIYVANISCWLWPVLFPSFPRLLEGGVDVQRLEGFGDSLVTRFVLLHTLQEASKKASRLRLAKSRSAGQPAPTRKNGKVRYGQFANPCEARRLESLHLRCLWTWRKIGIWLE
jgi:hypothetical protein